MRRRYLICYDVRDPSRLRAAHKLVAGHGDRLQYSVYVCDLTAQERLRLMARLRRAVHESIDSVVVFDLGEARSGDDTRVVETIGPAPSFPAGGPAIV